MLKHSRAPGATVTLTFLDAQLHVEVVDDGPGAANGGPATTGQGIVGMRERVALLGGNLETGGRSDGGFRVAARLPLDGET